MISGILRRTTVMVADAERAASFYANVFGWSRFYDNKLIADARFPPAADGDARAHLVIMKVEDSHIGMLGLMQYLEDDIGDARDHGREKLGRGDFVLMVESDDPDGIYERAIANGARGVSPAIDWAVPHYDGVGEILLRTSSFFDPDGTYIEVSARR